MPSLLPPNQIPYLETGDHLTRDEFMRRYEAMPHLKKAELIEGIVYIPGPVRLDHHGEPNGTLASLLGYYKNATLGVTAGLHCTVRLDERNELQPDIVLLITSAYQGQTTLSADGFIEGAPELVAETATTSASMELHTKKQVYQRHRVREYVVWRVLDQVVDWFVLREGVYQPLPLDPDGCYRSLVFPGLWLHVEGLLNDWPTAMRLFQAGLASPEHAAFVTELQRQRHS